ncbi:MAG: hypothetical protein AAF517_18480 [Planctomycetota bacterium]
MKDSELKASPLESLGAFSSEPRAPAWGVSMAADFGDVASEQEVLRDDAGLIDQSYRSVLDLVGANAEEMLARVLSVDPAKITPDAGAAACLLSAKGKLAGAFVLFRLADDHFRAVTFEPSRPELAKEFRKYAFLSDVDVVDRSAEIVGMGVHGPKASEALSTLVSPEDLQGPLASRCSLNFEGETVDCLRVEGFASETEAGGFELLAPKSVAAALWKKLAEAIRPVGWLAREAVRIAKGFPRYGFDYDEAHFPNEVAWEPALTYDRCYVGQEVVARMKTYGSVNRKIFRISAASPTKS